jgi:Tol biopolymer transport system component
MTARRWRAAAALALGGVATSCVLMTDLSGFSEPASGRTEEQRDALPSEASPFGALDAASSPCDLTAPFQNQTPITSLNTQENDELWPRLSPDELTMVLATRRAPNAFGIYVTTRVDARAGWSFPEYVQTVAVTPAAFDTDPMLTADGHALYFASDRRGTPDLFVSRRTGNTTFGPPFPIGELNIDTVAEYQPFLTFDGTELWFSREEAGFARIMRSAAGDGGYGKPAIVPELASSGQDWEPTLSADGLTIYFSSTRPGGRGDFDIWVAKRTTRTGTFGDPKPVVELNGPNRDVPGFLSTDGCRLYFDARRGDAGTADLYIAEKPPR